MTQITRSPGIPTGYMGLVAGGGMTGATEELDAAVQAAAEALAAHYGRDVMIRFNSDRKSGGAWIITHPIDDFMGNAEIGIRAGFYPDSAAIETLYAADLDRRIADVARDDPGPRYLTIKTYISARSRTYPSTMKDEYDTCTRVESVSAAIDYLKTHAKLLESY